MEMCESSSNRQKALAPDRLHKIGSVALELDPLQQLCFEKPKAKWQGTIAVLGNSREQEPASKKANSKKAPSIARDSCICAALTSETYLCGGLQCNLCHVPKRPRPYTGIQDCG